MRIFALSSHTTCCTTNPRTERYLTFSGIHDFVCSVHLDTTEPRAERYLPLSGIHNFVRIVHLDARPNHARNVI